MTTAMNSGRRLEIFADRSSNAGGLAADDTSARCRGRRWNDVGAQRSTSSDVAAFWGDVVGVTRMTAASPAS